MGTHLSEELRLGKLPVPEKGWQTEKINLEYTDCGCNAGWVSGIVLDPFAGAGNTLITATKFGRRYIGIELYQKYIDIINERLKGLQLNLRI